jgi:hypothetical protein
MNYYENITHCNLYFHVVNTIFLHVFVYNFVRFNTQYLHPLPFQWEYDMQWTDCTTDVHDTVVGGLGRGESKCLQRHSVGYHQAQKVLKWPHGIWAETAYPVE